MKELKAYIYNKCFKWYSILYDDLRKILELLGEGLFWKNILRKFLEIEPLSGNEIYVTAMDADDSLFFNSQVTGKVFKDKKLTNRAVCSRTGTTVYNRVHIEWYRYQVKVSCL